MSSNHEIRVRGLVIRDGKVLLAFLSLRDIYFLPGGRVKQDETLEEGVLRELSEELGCPVELEGYLGAIEHNWTDPEYGFYRDLTHFFKVRVDTLSTDKAPLCPDPGVELAWVPLEQLKQVGLRPPPLYSMISAWL